MSPSGEGLFEQRPEWDEVVGAPSRCLKQAIQQRESTLSEQGALSGKSKGTTVPRRQAMGLEHEDEPHGWAHEGVQAVVRCLDFILSVLGSCECFLSRRRTSAGSFFKRISLQGPWWAHRGEQVWAGNQWGVLRSFLGRDVRATPWWEHARGEKELQLELS